MKRALVTGGAGFIGSHLAELLLREGWAVRILDNLSTGKRANVPAEAEFVEGDLSRPPVDGVDTVFHLAAIASVPRSVEHPLESNRANAAGTLAVLRAASRAGVRRVVYAGSSSVYGDDPELPKRESMTPRPLSPYAVSKLAGEIYCAQAARHWGVETVSLRFFNVYGPRQDPNSPYAAVLPIFLARLSRGEPPPICGDGSQTRDFTYVGDVVQGLLRAAEVPGISGRVFNLAGGRPVSILDLARALAPETKPAFLPPRKGDILHSYADPAAVRQALGFAPETSLPDGLAATVKWFRNG